MQPNKPAAVSFELDEWMRRNEIFDLHLGCGSKYLVEFCNVDLNPQVVGETHRGIDVRIDVQADVTDLPTEGDMVHSIYSSHMVEHFSFTEAQKFLMECFRALKPAGTLVVEMPDRTRVSLLAVLGRLVRADKGVRSPLKHNIAESQFYGAYWEEANAPFAVHKFLWKRSDFICLAKQVGFELTLVTSSTNSHVPIRDAAYVFRKPGKGEDKLNGIYRYKSIGWRIKQKIKGLVILFGR